MSAAQDSPNEPQKSDASPAFAVAPELLAYARKRANLPPQATSTAADDEPVTAALCPAGRSICVVRSDGSQLPCEYSAPWPETGPTITAAELRSQLAANRLPTPNCHWCVTWASHGLLSLAPPIRDYGSIPVASDSDSPSHVTLRTTDNALSAAQRDYLAAEQPIEQLTVELHDINTTTAVATLHTLRDLPQQPRIVLRVERLDSAADAHRALDGLTVTHIELAVQGAATDQLEQLRQLAEACAATATVRFVLTPTHWFEFEAAIHASAAAGLAIDIRIQDRRGDVPVAQLSVADLHFVANVVGHMDNRLSSPNEPTSLAKNAMTDVVRELHAVLHERTEQAAEQDQDAASSLGSPPEMTPEAAPAPELSSSVVALALPAVNHGWNRDAQATWWWGHLIGHGQLLSIKKWAAATVAAIRDDNGEEPAWLRQLIHRISAESGQEDLMQRLRQLYGPVDNRTRLAAEDQAFLADFPVKKFGGPWADELGLQTEHRTRLLTIGEANANNPDDTPDITVLIPSYRHEAYIEEALLSVLAQHYSNFRVLVVDDRSPDDTVARAKRVTDPRVKVLVNDTNLGLGNSVLQALESIDTPYVALLNSDDLIHPERLGSCREVLESNQQVQLVTTGIALIDHQGGEITPDNASLILDGNKVYDWVQWFDRVTPAEDLAQEELFGELLERNFLATSSNLVARTDWLRKQAASLRSLKYCLDWQLFLEAALEGALHHIHEPLVAYRLHATNTVWFREGRRWSYYLEVNRVAADALQRFAEQDRFTAHQRLEYTLDAIATRLASNSEVDGFALFVHSLIDALQLDEATATSETVQALVEQLNNRANGAPQSSQEGSANDDGGIDRSLSRKARHEARRLHHEVAALDMQLMLAEDSKTLQGQEIRELYEDQNHRIESANEAELKIRELYEDQKVRMERSEQLDRDIQALHEDRELRIENAHEAELKTRKLYEDQKVRIELSEQLQRDIQALYEDQKQRIENAKCLDDDKKALYEDQKQRIASEQLLRNQVDSLSSDQQVAEQDLNETRALLMQRDHDLAESKAAFTEQSVTIANQTAALAEQNVTIADQTAALAEQNVTIADQTAALAEQNVTIADQTAALAEQKAAIAEQTAQVASLAESKNKIETKRTELLHQVANLQEEIERLSNTREFRTGNLIWNKMPLGYMSRRGKKWYRRLLNAKDRAKLMFKRKSNSKESHGTAVVAACWQWPIYSHTFVYQEMISLSHMGLDVQLFHWDLGSTDQLHAAFQYLYDHRTQLQPVWESHKKDLEHFEKTKPGKLRSFLERIAPLSGKSVEELEKESIVLQGCTFARMAELAQARYIHSYFFYDQSFMAMMAAWLLDLPRGVSCYADHMMDDYPWKFVPLHIELCDVIVATSARIKSELSEMTGGKYDDKIVVKPNGVDGERFPARKRPARKPDDVFEVLSVSRIEPKKGLTHLVEAMAQLRELGHTVVAHIIGAKDEHSKGSLEYAAEFEACIAEHGLQDQVILHGMMKQELMPPIIERCRAFVAPYVETESGDKDGIPTAMLEALASSLPVITTNSGSIVEVIDDGVEGWVVGQRDSTAFADALKKVITDPDLEVRMATAARARFDKDFDIRVTEKRLHERVTGFLANKV